MTAWKLTDTFLGFSFTTYQGFKKRYAKNRIQEHKFMDGFPIHEVFPDQMLLISHPVRHISTRTLLFELILV